MGVNARKIILFLAGLCALSGSARQLNDKVLNRPYADFKAVHLGFSVGLHMQDLTFTHNGWMSEDGQQWVIEQPAFSPGFCVNALVDFRLNNYFNVRLTPGLWFGNKAIEMRDVNSDLTERQNMKSTLVVMPIDLKYSALRYKNVRPYVTVGAVPMFDVTKRRSSDLLQLNKFDCMLSVGLGIDTYLPYFKFIPEVKFCWGVTDALRHKRPDLADDPTMTKFTNSLSKATQKMIVLTFYFE